MDNFTNRQPNQTETLKAEQEALIVLTKEEQTKIKGGGVCNCSTNDKRIKRVAYHYR